MKNSFASIILSAAAMFITFAFLVMTSEAAAQTSPKDSKTILLLSKEKKPYTVTEMVREKKDDGWSISFVDVEKSIHEQFDFNLELSYTEEAKAFLNNPYLQEDLVRFLSATGERDDSLVVWILNQTKGAKSLDEALDKLSKIDGYDVYDFDKDSAAYRAVAYTDPDSKRTSAKKEIKISVTNGIAKAELSSYSTGGGSTLYELYDVELGKRIQPSELLSNVNLPDTDKERSIKVVKIHSIKKDEIVYEATYVTTARKYADLKKGDSLLTDYAKSLMAKDKGYTKITTTNDFGDKILEYNFKYVNRDVLVPMELKGCANTKNIRNRMLDVMFGRHIGDMDSLIVEGVKTWNKPYESKKNMLLKVGDGLVSFGFEDEEKHDNISNVFIVFDKKTGKEISAKDLIKDKDGFMKFVNSHNIYLGGFLGDTTRIEEQSKKFGPDFNRYLRHSVGMGPFPGLSEFPISWWFAFNKMDEIVVVEFNTATSRIFLDYADIKKFMNPKYVKILDQAVRSIKKE